MNSGEIAVRAVKAPQGDTDVFALFLRGVDVLRIADISRIHRDEGDELKGFQRREIKKHVDGIVEFLDKGPALFPNAIILALRPEVQFKQTRGPSPEGAVAGTLHLPIGDDDHKLAWIVDGQQRSLALSRTKNQDIMVPVVAFIARDLEVQRQQFILVNKAKPLPRRLINELLPEISADLPSDLRPSKIPSELCNQLNRDPRSPFYRLIKRVSDEQANPSAVVTDTALIVAIKHSINNYGALALYKTRAGGRPDTDGMYRVLFSYWSAVRNVFSDAWGLPPTESRLMHSAGIQAMGILMDRIIQRVDRSPNMQEEIAAALERIAPHCRWTEGTWEGISLAWNDVQNLHKHVRQLAELLVQLDFAASEELA